MWTIDEAVELAKLVEDVIPQYGYHVALTGGLLYKDGPRKDCDLVLYRDGNERYELRNMLDKLETILNFDTQPDTQYRVHKATWRGKPVDLFLPENDGPYSDPLDESLKRPEVFIAPL